MRVAAIALVAVLAACAGFRVTEIGAIQRDADRYRDRTVTIRGTVVAALALPVIEGALYQVRDRTGEIWVQSGAGTPATGAEVTVTGVVRPGIEIVGHALGAVIVETRRTARP